MRTLFLLTTFLLLAGNSLLARPLSDRQIDSLSAKAEALAADGEYVEANELLEALIQNAESTEDCLSFLKFGLQKGVNLQKLKDYKASVAHLEGLEQWARDKIAEDDEDLLMLYHKLGVGKHYLREYPGAARYYKMALKGREKDVEKYSLDLFKGYYAIGYVYYEMGDFHSALKNLKRALSLQAEPSATELYRVYRVMSRTYREMGDFTQTKAYLALLQQYHASADKDRPLFLAGLSLDQANFFNEFEKGEEAILHARAALEKLQEAAPLEKEGLATKANALHNLGEGYRLLGQYGEALAAFQESLAINEDINGALHHSTARSFNNIGLTYLNMGQYELAAVQLEEAIRIKRQLNNPVELASSLNNMGDVWMAQKEYRKAAECYHQAACYSSPFCNSFDFQHLLSVEEVFGAGRQSVVVTLTGKAQALHALSRQKQSRQYLEQAFSTYRVVGELVDQIRASYQTDRSKEFLIRKTKDIYEGAIAASLELYRQSGERRYFEQALTFSEKSKSIILAEAVLRSNEALFAGVPEGLRFREQQFKGRLATAERQLAEAKAEEDSAEAHRLTKELVALHDAYQLLKDSILQEYPEYFNLLLSAGTVSLKDIQRKLLSRGQAMVEYFRGKEHLYLFVVQKRRFFVEELPLDFPLAEWVKCMREGIFRPHSSGRYSSAFTRGQYQAQYAEYGYRLYQKIFSPLEKHRLPEKLLLIPDGVLGYVPFEALLATPVLKAGKFQQYSFLLEKYQISYAYSATILLELKERPIYKPSGELLAVAPSFDGLLATNTRSTLGPLFFNRQEVNQIGQVFEGRILQEKEALKEVFLKLAPLYRIIHISSHAKASDIDPNQSSYIAFTQEQARLNENQLLYLWELYNAHLKAEMVVLSACEAGLGQLLEGEGIISLARAFSYAGAKSVITTLWQVNDESTAELMVRFYQRLNEGKSKSKALTRAKKSFLASAKTADPYFWAGFIATGDMAPLQPNPWIWALRLAALLAGMAVVGWLYVKRKA